MKNILLLLLLFQSVVLPNVESVQAQEVEIKDIVVTNSDTDLLLYLSIIDAFTPEIVDGIHSGLPATFTFEIKLIMERTGWTDKEIYSGSTDNTIIYDNLKKDYTIYLGDQGSKPVKIDQLEEAKAIMSELDGFKVVSLNKLSPDRKYSLEVRAILAKKTLPFYFNYIIPFGNFWDFDTDWYTVRFRY